MIEAFSALVRDLASGPDATALRERIVQATAPNAAVIVDAIPDLRALIGDQPPVKKIGTIESEHRFQLVFAAFVRALLAEQRSVLFIDDLHWLDPGSLKLLHTIAADPDVRSLLIFCASRPEALDSEHLVTRTLYSIQRAGARVTRVELGQLDADSLVAFLCDALRAQPADVADLATIIQRKTGSNPFFVRQFLGYLYREQLLVFDTQRNRWAWDLARIELADVTPNVVDLLAKAIETLPSESHRALRAAACIGNRFEVGLLAHVLDQELDDTARALWTPVQHGLIVPVAEGPRFSWIVDKPIELEKAASAEFRFVHDRIQEAAYQGIPEEARKGLHLRIARWLEEKAPQHVFDVAVGAIVDQYNRAADDLPEAERIRLAGLNARAGQQARSTGALASALGYFQVGLELLPPEPWREQHALWFALLRDAAECVGLLGDMTRCDALVDAGLARTEDLLEKVELYAIAVRADAFNGLHERAIERGRQGLAILGVDLPQDPSPELVNAERTRTQTSLRQRSDAELLDAPPLEDPVDKAKLQLLTDLSSAWFASPGLYTILASLAADLSATKGLAPGSGVAYAQYAVALALVGHYDEAYRCGRLSVQLAERTGSATQLCRSLVIVATQVSPWRAPLWESVVMLQRAHPLGLESGDPEFAAYALVILVNFELMSGTELTHVLVDAESAVRFYQRTHHLSGLPVVQRYIQAVRCLRGLTRGPHTFDDDRFSETRFREDAADNALGQTVFHVLRLQVCYILGILELAWKYALDAKTRLGPLRSVALLADFHLYAGLTALRLGHSASEHLAALEIWANSAPTNFQHKRDLVAAELARIETAPPMHLPLPRCHRASRTLRVHPRRGTRT